ncbi:MAG: PilZ domain-containing protein [Dehalococcoidia bacterium]|nr:PilZ domain-containing protein [Dehalococcoidia bacterium]
MQLERRQFRRYPLWSPARLEWEAGQVGVLVGDISAGGALLYFDGSGFTLDHGLLELSLADDRLRLPFTVVRIGEAWGRPLVQVQFEASVRDLPGLQSLLGRLHDLYTSHDHDLAVRPNDSPHALLPVVRERAS